MPFAINTYANGISISLSSSGNRMGKYPRKHWKGETPVEMTAMELCVYSPWDWKWGQVAGFCSAIKQRPLSSSWFRHSAWPLVSGWNPEDRLGLAPMREQKAHKNILENWGPWLDMFSRGSPWCRNMSRTASGKKRWLGEHHQDQVRIASCTIRTTSRMVEATN